MKEEEKVQEWPLPEKYERVLRLFEAMDYYCSENYLHTLLSYELMKEWVESTTQLQFHVSDLSQIASIYPEAFTFEIRTVHSAIGGSLVHYISIDPNIQVQFEPSLSSYLSEDEDDNTNDYPLRSRLNHLLESLLLKVKFYHDLHLLEIDYKGKYRPTNITHGWIESFDLNSVPELPLAFIPPPAGTTPPLKSERKRKRPPPSSNEVKTKRLKGEAWATPELMELQSLVKLCMMLRQFYAAENKTIIVLHKVVQMISNSYKQSEGIDLHMDDIKYRLNLIQKFLPFWCETKAVGREKYLLVRKDMDFSRVRDAIDDQIDSLLKSTHSAPSPP